MSELLLTRKNLDSKIDVFFQVIKNNKGIIFAVLAAAAITFLPTPQPLDFGDNVVQLTREGQLTVALMVGLVIIFVTEALPIGATVAVVYVWAVFFGIGKSEEVVRIFSHDAAWFLIGALMIAEILIKYNLHQRILLIILRFSGTKVRNVVFGIVAFCALGAAFIADHTLAAMMLPVVLAIISMSGGYKKVPRLSRLLMFSVAYGVAIGGVGAPSGGGRNVVMIGFLKEYFDISISYGAWLAMGLPLVVILIPVLAFILPLIFKPEVDDLSKAVNKIKNQVRMGSMSWNERATALIFLVLIALFILKSDLGLGVIALFGALLFLVFRLATWKDYQKINWGIGLLYFGAVGFGSLLHSTGAAAWLAAKTVSMVTSVVPLTSGIQWVALGTISTAAFTQVVSDGPAVASVGPVFLEMTKFVDVDPVILGVSIAMSSAFAFALLMGTPANAIIYGSGYLSAVDFLKAGLLMMVVSVVALLVVVAVWWPILGVGAEGFH